jgi:hypothetical protein
VFRPDTVPPLDANGPLGQGQRLQGICPPVQSGRSDWRSGRSVPERASFELVEARPILLAPQQASICPVFDPGRQRSDPLGVVGFADWQERFDRIAGGESTSDLGLGPPALVMDVCDDRTDQAL